MPLADAGWRPLLILDAAPALTEGVPCRRVICHGAMMTGGIDDARVGVNLLPFRAPACYRAVVVLVGAVTYSARAGSTHRALFHHSLFCDRGDGAVLRTMMIVGALEIAAAARRKRAKRRER